VQLPDPTDVAGAGASLSEPAAAETTQPGSSPAEAAPAQAQAEAEAEAGTVSGGLPVFGASSELMQRCAPLDHGFERGWTNR